MPYVLKLKNGKLITPFDLADVLEVVGEYAGDGYGGIWRKTSQILRNWKKSWMGCTGSMRKSWNARATSKERF